MLSIQKDKIDSLFEAIAQGRTLYLPVDNTSGNANFEKWQSGKKLSAALKTVRSAKDFFFPKTERLVNYKIQDGNITVEDPRKEVEDFVIFGVRACDAKSFEVFDKVYVGDPKYVDSYYKNRRDHGTVITFACNSPAETCFCKAYDIDASAPVGDVTCWEADGEYFFNPNTDKGTALLESVKSMLSEKDEKPVVELKAKIKEKIEKLPFSKLDLSKFKGKDMLKLFNAPVWQNLSEACLGCGTCTYVCPTCMCFDVRDFDNGKGIQQVRCWDSCMYSDFTQMAAENPRHTQKERFRQRFMHKLLYYPMAHDGLCMCVGCGRCLESYPIHMNIVKVIKEINSTDLENSAGGK